MRKSVMHVALLAMIAILVLSACGGAVKSNLTPLPAAPTFGMLMVGAKTDQGWSQAHYDAGLYIEQKIPGAKMLYLENVYSGSPSYPGQTASQLAEQLVSQGAQLIIFNSDDMKDEALKFANAHPDIYVIGASDDWTWKEGENYQDITQSGQHHGSDGIWQNDRRLRRCPDHKNG